jgi:hypothetical protein
MRKRRMGSMLVQLAVRGMRDGGCDEAVLETEVSQSLLSLVLAHTHTSPAHPPLTPNRMVHAALVRACSSLLPRREEPLPLPRPSPPATAQITNSGALRLYEGLGFVRDKRLHRYYLNGNDAFRLKVWFKPPHALESPPLLDQGEEELAPAASDPQAHDPVVVG